MKSNNSIYFIGIGGIGMSALARYFLAKKWAVSGSDAVESSITDSLKKDGINVKIGHKKANIGPKTALVVYNRAILPNNPELIEARRRKIPALPYAEVLGEITKEFMTVAITGSHGKSTTTALTGLALMKGGFDPTIFIGTNLKELGGKNIRIGKSPYLVLEADDFGAAFLSYSPSIAVVTNIDREHMDFYRTFGNVKNAFINFLLRTQEGGAWVLNREDKILFSLRRQIIAAAKKKRIKVVWYSADKKVPLAGEHNRSNAAAAFAVGKLLNIPGKKIASAIAGYRGAWRRMEFRGAKNIGRTRVQIFDDYAHHPTEITATLRAFKEKFPRSPLVCVFQPHQAKRLAGLFKEFRDAFRTADVTILLPIYKVKGRDERAAKTSEMLVAAMHKRFPKQFVFYAPHARHLSGMLKKIFSELKNPVLIMMGAGDIVDISNRIARSR